MISDDKLYEVLSALIADRKQSCTDAFKLFIKLYVAIVGGAVGISTQISSPARPIYASVSVVLIVIVTAVATLLLFEAKRGWWEYRKAQSKIVAVNAPNRSYHIPPPKWFPTLLAEIVMGLCMWVAAGLYIGFNPLR